MAYSCGRCGITTSDGPNTHALVCDAPDTPIVVWVVSEWDYEYSEPLAVFTARGDAERMEKEQPSYSVREVVLYGKGERTPQPVYKSPPPRQRRGGGYPAIASMGYMSPYLTYPQPRADGEGGADGS